MALPRVPGRHGLAVQQAMLTDSQPEQHRQGYVGKAAFGESPAVGRSKQGLPWPGIQLPICTSSASRPWGAGAPSCLGLLLALSFHSAFLRFMVSLLWLLTVGSFGVYGLQGQDSCLPQH